MWYDDDIQYGERWWQQIIDAIAEHPIFMYVLSSESVASRYCQAEYIEAQRLQKRIILVQERDRTPLSEELQEIQYVDMHKGVENANALNELHRAIHYQQRQIPSQPLPPLPESVTPCPPKQKESKQRPSDQPEVDTPPLTSTRADSAVEDKSTTAIGIYRQASDAMKQGDLKQARKCFQQVIELDPKGYGEIAKDELEQLDLLERCNKEHQHILAIGKDFPERALRLWKKFDTRCPGYDMLEGLQDDLDDSPPRVTTPHR